MNTDTGVLRFLEEYEKPKKDEILVAVPKPDCIRCKGVGSIPLGEGTRPERRRAYKNGLPIWAKYLGCPECNKE